MGIYDQNIECTWTRRLGIVIMRPDLGSENFQWTLRCELDLVSSLKRLSRDTEAQVSSGCETLDPLSQSLTYIQRKRFSRRVFPRLNVTSNV